MMLSADLIAGALEVIIADVPAPPSSSWKKLSKPETVTVQVPATEIVKLTGNPWTADPVPQPVPVPLDIVADPEPLTHNV